MENFITNMIAQCSWLQSLPKWVVVFGFQIFFSVLILFAFVAIFAMLAGYVERRVAGRIQSRIGPNRVGPQGILQSLADGIKVFLKEDVVPTAADPILFRIAPYFVFVGMFLAFVAIPFSAQWVISDFNLGIFYLLACEALVVIGIVMSGWASNNKWSLIGGMRSAAQIVSYEVPVSLTILMIVLWCGTMDIQQIILSQGPMPWHWHVFQNPFLFIGFFIFFIGSLAEGNRMPFDMPEAESELVSGYNTEYSGFRFIIFFFAEFANLYLIGAIVTILFLGGWQAGVLPEFFVSIFGAENPWIVALIKNFTQLFVFQAKALVLVFVIIQLRWTLPRVRVDQLMALCWKYLVPISFVNLLAISFWVVFVPEIGTKITAGVMTTFGAIIFIYFFYRVYWQLKFSKAKIRMNPFS